MALAALPLLDRKHPTAKHSMTKASVNQVSILGTLIIGTLDAFYGTALVFKLSFMALETVLYCDTLGEKFILTNLYLIPIVWTARTIPEYILAPKGSFTVLDDYWSNLLIFYAVLYTLYLQFPAVEKRLSVAYGNKLIYETGKWVLIIDSHNFTVDFLAHLQTLISSFSFTMVNFHVNGMEWLSPYLFSVSLIVLFVFHWYSRRDSPR